MKKYRKVLKVRIRALYFVILLAAGMGIFNVFGTNSQMKESIIFSFQSGFITALGVLGAFLVIQYRKALKDEQKLALLFNRENDERMKVIKAKAGMPMLLISSAAMIVIGVVAGYFNLTVFYTLIAAAMCQLLVGCAVKVVYMKKM